MGPSFLRRTVGRTLGSARNVFTHAPLRLRILLAVLAVVGAGAAASTIGTWYLERQLSKVAEGIVADFNVQSPLAVGEEPSADTTYKILCSNKYLLVGPVTGKIMFFITPKCYTDHARSEASLACLICSGRATRQLDYIYLHGKDGWEFQESYIWRHGEP